MSSEPDALDGNLKRTAETYDAMPYDCKPVPRTHPARLAAVARFFGLEAPLPGNARVLELGCAAGGNLIPLAQFYPESRFLGVDLGAVQIAQGQERIAQAGLTNVELRCESITDLADDLGTFDYILCHGVYSWVPAPVQEKILEICGRNLAPDGIAYISYNVLPGWRLNQPLRDVFRLMIPADQNAATRSQSARALLRYLGEMTPETGVYGTLLKQAAHKFDTNSDSYLYHEYMEVVNEPCAFGDFMAAAGRNGLGYLGESEFFAMFAERYGTEFAEKLDRTTNDDIVAYEQMLDILTGNSFRMTLLVHADRLDAVDRSLSLGKLENLYFMGSNNVRCEKKGGEITLSDNAGTSNTYDDPMIVKLLDRLFPEVPSTVSYNDCLDGFAPERIDAARETIMQLAVHGIITVSTEAMVAASPGEWPRAHPLARADVSAGRNATANRLHMGVQIEDIPQFLIPFLDGTNDRAALTTALRGAIISGRIALSHKNGQPLSDEELDEAVPAYVEVGLGMVANAGLLEA